MHTNSAPSPDRHFQRSFELLRSFIPQVAREEILTRFNNVVAESKVSADGSRETVTAADLITSARLMQELRKFLPHSSSEEDLLESRLQSPAYWLVDPVDGTDEFIAGMEHGYAVLATLIAKTGGKYDACASIVYRPGLDEMWSVDTAGKVTHTINDRPAVPAAADRSAVRGYIRAVDPGTKLQDLYPELGKKLGIPGYGLLRGGAGAALADLLDGTVNLVILNFNYSKEWDIAAAIPLIRALGGFVCDLDGQEIQVNRRDPYNYRGFVFSTAFTRDEILPLLPKDLLENRLVENTGSRG